MSEFLEMGGYGAYVWSCFGLTAAVLCACVISPYAKLHSLQRELRCGVDEDDLDT